MRLNSVFRYYSDDQLATLKDKIFQLLEKRGVKIDHDGVLSLLKKGGAVVDSETGIVRFPRAFMEEQIEKTPKQFVLAGRDGHHPITFPHPEGLFYTRPCTGGQTWIHPRTGAYERMTLQNLAYWARLSQQLDHIDYVPFLVPDDAPSATADIYALRVMLENVDKHIWIQPYTGESVTYLVELLVAAAGGKKQLEENPLASWITCSLTPLVFKWMDMEIIVQAAGHGCAVQPCSLPTSGVTGPFTEAGSVLLAVAENLVMLAVAQLVRPGTPIVATSLQFSGDMSTGRSLQSSVESLRQSALFPQLMQDAFNIPAQTYGSGCDSPDIDAQAMAERAMRAMLIANAGASVLGGAGQLETACTVSPVALVIDNEIFKMAKAIIREMTFDEDALAWDDLMRIDYGGQFLTTTHTFNHCRNVEKPIHFTRQDHGSWAADGSRDLIDRVRAYLDEHMKNSAPPQRPEALSHAFDDIIQRADKHLAG